MPTFTTVDAAWLPGPMEFTDVEARRFDTAMFAGDGTANGVRGGVVRHGPTSLAVTVDGSDRVIVQPGVCAIPAPTGLGVYRGALQAAVGPSASTALTTRNATNPRIDLIVAEATAAGMVVRTVDGVPGAAPSAPALPAQCVELARVTVPAVGGGAVTVDSSWRSYAVAPGGAMVVETAARLPGSGLARGQRATALDTGTPYRWDGAAWVADYETAVPVPAASGNYTSATVAYRSGQAVTVYVSINNVNASAAGAVAANIPASLAPPRSFSTPAELIDLNSGSPVLCTLGANGAITIGPARSAGQVLVGKVTYVR